MHQKKCHAMKYMSKDVRVDTERISAKLAQIKEQYRLKIRIFGEENELLEAENKSLRLRAEKLKQEVYEDDLSEFERSVIAGSRLFTDPNEDLDEFDNLYSDINSVIESLSINLE